MEPIYVSIQQKETGNRIKTLLAENGYTVKDIQGVMGFENPQAIYKWLSGKTLPSLDNLLILSRVLHTSMEDILVVDGDISVFRQNCQYNYLHLLSQLDHFLKSRIRVRQSVLSMNKWECFG